MRCDRRLFYGAIELGTTYSGFTFASKHELERACIDDKVSFKSTFKSKAWNTGTSFSNKTLTCVLLNKDKQFVDFGYDAEKNYLSLLEDGQYEDLYFFRQFTTILFEEQVHT